jgi:hypothetical protein
MLSFGDIGDTLSALIDSLRATPESTVYLLFHDAKAEKGFLSKQLQIDISSFKQGVHSAYGPGVVIIDTQEVFRAWSGKTMVKCSLKHCCQTLQVDADRFHNAGKKNISSEYRFPFGQLFSVLGNDAHYTVAIFEAMMNNVVVRPPQPETQSWVGKILGGD